MESVNITGLVIEALWGLCFGAIIMCAVSLLLFF